MKQNKTIKLGENEYKVRMSVGVLIDIEDELGKPLTQLSNEISIKQATVFLKHAARKLDGSRIPEDEWKALIYEIDVAEMFVTLGEIMQDLNPKKGEGEQVKNG